MNVYVIYKFAHWDTVSQKIEEVNSQVKNVSFFAFDPNCKNPFWRVKARKKIKNSNYVVFFDIKNEEKGNSNSKTGKEKPEDIHNLLWELKYAEKKNKRIIYFHESDKPLSTTVFKLDYSERQIDTSRYRVYSLNDFVDFFKRESSWSMENNLLNFENSSQTSDTSMNGNAPYLDKSILIEQYRIMVETTEKVMERRQNLSTLYTTICTGILAFLGATLTFENSTFSLVSALISGFIIFFFCANWKKSLIAYDLNNSGKFAVINEIEKHLPAEMFECEYRYNTMNGMRSYSNREKILPTIFQAFGIIIMAVSIIFLFPKIPEILSIVKNVIFNK